MAGRQTQGTAPAKAWQQSSAGHGEHGQAHSEPRTQRASLDGSSMEPKKEKHVMGLGQRAGGQEKWVEEAHLQSLLSARDGDQGHSGRGDRGRAGGRQADGSYSYRRQRHRRGRRMLSAWSSGATGGTVLAVLRSKAPVCTADLDRCPGKKELL